MQTSFTPEQLADPRISDVEKILRTCVHCGFCTATCSTYVLVKDERDSPRGRIYMMKDMFEQGRAAPAEVQFHVDRCLSCLSCMTTCPSGVDYMHLVDHARAHIEETGQRPFSERLVRGLLAAVVPYPGRFRWALRLAPLGRPFRGLMRKAGLPQLAAMIDLAPTSFVRAARFTGAGTAETRAERKGRVIMLAGCAQQVLRPEINDATIRLFARRGIDVVVANNAGCCGALTHHMGKEAAAIEAVKRNVDAWSKEIERAPVDAIVINASGCGTTVKDYGHMMRGIEGYAERAARISKLTLDVSEYLAQNDLGPPARWSSLRIAYHSACSLQHGQQVTLEPKVLLKKAGFTVLDVADSHICCGSAGTYNILQPDLAGELKTRKIGHLMKTKPDLIAAGNIGCITHLGTGLDVPIVHTIELLDWAYGGPVPRGLEKLKKFVSDVPAPARTADDYLLA